MKKVAGRIIVIAALVLILPACATSTNVAKINANKRGHLATEFASESLGSRILAQIRRDNAESKDFQQIDVRFFAAYEEVDSKIKNPVISTTYINVGHGMVQQLSEISSNGIPYRLIYSLTYRGILPLKHQNVPLESERTRPIGVTKKIGKLPMGSSTLKEDTEYTFEFAVGHETQIADFWKFGITCRSSRRYAANDIHRNLSGTALDLACEYSRDGVSTRKTRYIFLERYGLGLLLEDAGITYKLNSTIVDVSIR